MSAWFYEANDKCKNSECGFSYLYTHVGSALQSKEIRNICSGSTF